jgi:PTH1 family peptidyl-tRNA hydrolase
VHRWGIDLSELFIILDDVDLPLGSIRIRPKGGDGCHRGMESVIYQLGNTHFPRIRFGIAVEGEKLRPSEKYVLKPFKKKDSVLADEKIVDTANAVESILRNGLNKTMNNFN